MPTPSLLIVPARFKSGKLYSQIPTSGEGDFTVTRATSATRVNASGLIESVASGIPRLDYFASGGTVGCPALLVEPAATNLFQNSVWAGGGVPPSGWSQPFSTGTASAETSTLNPSASAYLFTTAGTRMVFSQSISQTSGTIYTLSVYVEQVISGSLTVENLIGYNFSVAGISTYLENDVVVLGTHNVQSGRRYSLRITAPSTASAQSRVGNGIGSVATASVRLSMPQIETGSVATSFIPSSIGSTSTRNADVVSVSGAVSGSIGQTEGVLYIECESNFANDDIIAINRNISNAITIYKGGSNQVIGRVYASGATFSFASSATTGVMKIALAYKSGDSALFLNGAQVGSTNTTAITFSSALNLISMTKASSYLVGTTPTRIRAAALYTTRLTNAELAALTSP